MNKFGRSLPTSSSQKGIKVLQAPNEIPVTSSGDYNFRSHRLCNVKTPVDKDDAVNREFVEGILIKYSNLANESVANLKQEIINTQATIQTQLKAHTDLTIRYNKELEERITKNMAAINSKFTANSKKFETRLIRVTEDSKKFEDRLKIVEKQQ